MANHLFFMIHVTEQVLGVGIEVVQMQLKRASDER